MLGRVVPVSGNGESWGSRRNDQWWSGSCFLLAVRQPALLPAVETHSCFADRSWPVFWSARIGSSGERIGLDLVTRCRFYDPCFRATSCTRSCRRGGLERFPRAKARFSKPVANAAINGRSYHRAAV